MSLLLLISVIPVFLLAVFIYSKDSAKEPSSLLLGLFVSGFLAAILVVLIDVLFSRFIPNFFIIDNIKDVSFFKLFSSVLLGLALVEEFFKWLMIRFLGYNHKDFDQFYDIIVYSVFVALGFAMIENIFYVVPGGISLGLFRAIFSIPGHASFGVFMGFFLGLAKSYEKKDKVLSNVYMFYAVLIPTLLHTIYNFCLLTDKAFFFVMFIIFVIILYITAFVIVSKVSKANEDIINKER